MITFTELTLQGFRSFKEEQVYAFPEDPQFILVTGKNKVDPELGANGTGKSSFFDGLVWTLYGKTGRGLSGPAIANWDREHLTRGSVKFRTEDGTNYTLQRTWHPNTLTLDRGKGPKTVTQERIDDLLKTNYESFVGNVLMGQFDKFFFDLSPTEKLSVFSNALGLDYWTRRSDKARRLARDKAGELATQATELAKREGEAQALLEVRGEWANLKLQFQQNKKQRIAKLQKERKNLCSELERLEESVGRQRKMVDAKSEEVSFIRHAIQDYEAKVRIIDGEIEDERRELRTLQSQLREVDDTEKQLKAKPKECPTCGGKLDPTQFAEQISKVKKQQNRIAIKAAAHLSRKRELEDERKEYDERLELLREQRTAKSKDEGELRTRYEKAKDEWHTADQDLDVVKRELRNTEDETNPYPQKIEQQDKRIEELQRRIRTLKKDIQKNNEQQRQYEQWSQLFKELRLWLIEDAVAELQREVTNSLQQLGLKDWRVKCVVEKATNKGKVQRGFDVLISNSRTGKHSVPWKSWSGGETQRLRIAGARGFQSLVRSRASQRFNIEVWDEPTAHVSEEGLQDLLGFFEGITRDEQRTVYLVDHRTLRAGNFDGGVRIVNTDAGSKIRVTEAV